MICTGKCLPLLLGLALFLSANQKPFQNQLPIIRHVYLTWQHDTSTTITINIHGLRTPNELYVYYDTSPKSSRIHSYGNFIKGKKVEGCSIPDGRNLYHIELENLQPGQMYYFTIGDSSHAFTHEQHFRTIPSSYENLIFVEGGDWENTNNAKLLARKAGEQNPSAIFLGGDYPSGVCGKEDYAKWDIWLDNFEQEVRCKDGSLVPMVLAIGNHEVVGGFGKDATAAPFYFDYFFQGDQKKSFFSLKFGPNLQLLVLDSGHTQTHCGEQLEWLKNELENSSNMPIKMALYHVPLYPSIRFAQKDTIYRSLYKLVEFYEGPFKAEKLFSKESNLGRIYWLPLFDRYNLTVGFEHHDQTLKRTKLLKNGKEDVNGTLYLGDGGWGPQVQYPAIQGYFNPYFAQILGKVHFFWVVKIFKTYIEYLAMNHEGKIIDQFIQKIKHINNDSG